jgi:hypothetical protein
MKKLLSSMLIRSLNYLREMCHSSEGGLTHVLTYACCYFAYEEEGSGGCGRRWKQEGGWDKELNWLHCAGLERVTLKMDAD